LRLVLASSYANDGSGMVRIHGSLLESQLRKDLSRQDDDVFGALRAEIQSEIIRVGAQAQAAVAQRKIRASEVVRVLVSKEASLC
jgi:hypothetical protein